MGFGAADRDSFSYTQLYEGEASRHPGRSTHPARRESARHYSCPARPHPELEENVQHLRDEIALLKGQKPRPTIKPSLLEVTRPKTERPEGIAAGSSRLVGTDRDRIVTEARRLLHTPRARAAMSRSTFPFGDGHASTRIAALISAWLAQRAATRRLA